MSRFGLSGLRGEQPGSSRSALCRAGREHAYVKATLELTRDGGRTWTSLGTPMAPAHPEDVADFLSCPVPAGCIAVASDPNEAQPTWEVLSNLHRGQ